MPRFGDLPRDLFRQRQGGNGSMPVEEWQRRRKGTFSPARLFSTSAESTQLLPDNLMRSYLLISNVDTTNDLWVQLSLVAVANECIRIPPGGVWEPWTVPTNSILVIGGAVGTRGVVLEGGW